MGEAAICFCLHTKSLKRTTGLESPEQITHLKGDINNCKRVKMLFGQRCCWDQIKMLFCHFIFTVSLTRKVIWTASSSLDLGHLTRYIRRDHYCSAAGWELPAPPERCSQRRDHVALGSLGLVGDMGRRDVLVPVWETEPIFSGVAETSWTSRVRPEEEG